MRAAAAGVLIGVIVGGIVVGGDRVSHAQPAPDLANAKDLYKAAESAMAAGRFADASAVYSVVYDITKDPVLFYKIGSASQKAGKCDVALISYGRYLREAKPVEQFVVLTHERIIACGGDPSVVGAVDPEGTTSAGADDPAHGPGSGSGRGTRDGAPATALVRKPAIGRNKGAWLLVSGSIAFATIGAVLAYSATSAENDVADLYVSLGDQPPVFDARTQKTYEALLSDGHRYEVLSWVSLGLAGAAAAGAAVLFLRNSGEHADRTVRISPTVHREGGGVAATVRF